METGLGRHREREMTDAGKKCRWEKKSSFWFLHCNFPPVSGNFLGLDKGISSNTLGLLTPFPMKVESLKVGALRADHRAPTQIPSYLVQRSVSLSLEP